MNHFNFEYPLVFGLILVFILCAKYCKEKSRAIYFPHIKSLLIKEVSIKKGFLFWLKWIGIVSAITALASPVLTKTYIDSKKNGRDIVLIVDASDSMRQRGFDAKDRFKNKFQVVKEVMNDFISKEKVIE